MKINWTNVAEEAIGATISAGFIALIVFIYNVITGNAQASSWLWIGLATLVISIIVASAYQTFRKLLSTLGRWIVSNWRLVVGVVLLISTVYGAFILTHIVWVIVLVIGLVIATIFLSQYRSSKEIQGLREKLKQSGVEVLPLNLIANAHDLSIKYRNLAMGEQWFNGIPFLLNASYFDTNAKETRLATPKLNPPIAQVSSVHVLVNAENAWKRYKETELEGTTIGKIKLLFNDGNSEETKFILGRNVREWDPGNKPGSLVDIVTDKSSKLAWVGKNTSGNEAVIDHLEIPTHAHYRTRLEQIVITKDTHPETPQDSLELFILAITVECQ